MRKGGTFRDASAAAQSVRDANQTNYEQSQVLASAHGRLATMEMAQHARRPFGSMGESAR